jgi:hypothetical protein
VGFRVAGINQQLDPEESARHLAEGYQALGRYFAEFSDIIGSMELAMVQYLQRAGVPSAIAPLPFGALTADKMVSVFFDVTRAVRQHDEKEQRIAKKLRVMVRDELSFRNDAAHGHWMIGFYAVTVFGPGTDTPPRPIPPTLDRTKPGREAGTLVSEEADLDAKADKLAELGGHLYHYTDVCFDRPKEAIRDYVRLDDSNQIIPGPKSLLAKPQNPD